jgi:hypothetical protein
MAGGFSRFAAILIPLALSAQQLPVGTELSVRLKTALSSRDSRAGEGIEAVLIAPVLVQGKVAIAPGAIVGGAVDKVVQPTATTRAGLQLVFREISIGGEKRAMSARVGGVENAKETVDEHGAITGILAAETISGQMDAGLEKLNDQYSGFASILSAAKNAVFRGAATDITFPAGAELTLRLAESLTLPAGAGTIAWPALPLIEGRGELVELAVKQPFRTVAERPPDPSDITNLMFVGTEEALRKVFADAGWSVAAKMTTLSKFETVRAIAEGRGYTEAPVSLLMLDGKAPDLVFEKTTDTFARRHHMRVWRRPGSFHGLPVWLAAATHDTGIDFSESERTFIHRIDSQLDREREKVVNDLLFTGAVAGYDLIERADVPRRSANATKDSIETDGKLAVLLLR